MNNYQGAIIVLCRNRADLTRPCILSLLNQTVHVDVLAINNASTDHTSQTLRSLQAFHSNLRVLTMPAQRSVAYCWNEGLRWAWAAGYDRALVVNNDTELRPDTYQKLSLHMLTSSAGMVTAVSRRERAEVFDVEPALESSRPHPDFSCFMIDRGAYLLVGCFDEHFEGAYCEDGDYHIRMHLAGIPAVCIDQPFLHHASGTLKGADEKEAQKIRACHDANQTRLYDKWGVIMGTKPYNDIFSPANFGRGVEEALGLFGLPRCRSQESAPVPEPVDNQAVPLRVED